MVRYIFVISKFYASYNFIKQGISELHGTILGKYVLSQHEQKSLCKHMSQICLLKILKVRY